MKILITGIAGFIGFHTAKRLLDQGIEIVGVDSLNEYYDVKLKIDRLKMLNINFDGQNKVQTAKNITFIKGDISDDFLWTQLESYNISSVIHLAAQAGVRYSLENPKAYIISNVVGFQNVIDFCIKQKIKSLLYASSSSVYGMNSKQPFNENEACTNPESLYAATKRSNELVAESYYKTKGLISIGLRFFTVYGPWGRPDMAPMLFAKAALSGNSIEVFNNGNQKRDFTYIDDIVEGIVKCFSLLKTSQLTKAYILNIGLGEPVGLMDFIKEIENKFNKKVKINYQEAQKGDVNITYADTSKLRELTKFEPQTSLSEGLSKFSEWYFNYYNK